MRLWLSPDAPTDVRGAIAAQYPVMRRAMQRHCCEQSTLEVLQTCSQVDAGGAGAAHASAAHHPAVRPRFRNLTPE